MRILRDAFARGWNDLLLNFNRVTCPGTPSAAVMSRRQWRITAVCLAGGLALASRRVIRPDTTLARRQLKMAVFLGFLHFQQLDWK